MFDHAFNRLHKIPLLLIIASLVCYAVFAYDLVRSDHTKLILLYAALFMFFYFLMQFAKNEFRLLVIAALLFRLVFLFAIPNLSQDFYRFIWDGRMLFQGYNPFLSTPQAILENGTIAIHQGNELITGMGGLNASHFSNYPPIMQFVFGLAAMVSGKSIIGSVIVFRTVLILADFGTLYFGKKLLARLKIPVNKIFWYILNPFIIIELTGNLHFEGLMIFFLVWSLYLLYDGKWKWAAVVFALSISVKLLPLMLLPLFYKYFKNNFNLKKLIGFYFIVGVVCLILFAAFFSLEFVENYSKTVALWFNNFEFNASIYYILREIGYSITGYNEIAIIGKILAFIATVAILIIAFFKQIENLQHMILAMLLATTLYFFLSTTVHPWYIATLLILSIFTRYKFALIWSCMVILSYLAYGNTSTNENLWIIALEYVVVYLVFVWEVILKKNFQINFERFRLRP